MGEVYLAEHQLLKRPCALKRIHPKLPEQPGAGPPVRAGGPGDGAATAPEHGRDLRLRPGRGRHLLLRDGVPAGAEPGGHGGAARPAAGRSGCVHVLRQVCGALREAHRQGLVHRDIKPSNILVFPDGSPHDQAKLLDFGLVHSLDEEADPDAKITREGLIVGTPEYMTPGAGARRRCWTAAATCSAWGAVAYYLLTGREAFHRENPMKTLMAVVNEDPAPVGAGRRGRARRTCVAVLKRCLAKAPGGAVPAGGGAGGGAGGRAGGPAGGRRRRRPSGGPATRRTAARRHRPQRPAAEGLGRERYNPATDPRRVSDASDCSRRRLGEATQKVGQYARDQPDRMSDSIWARTCLPASDGRSSCSQRTSSSKTRTTGSKPISRREQIADRIVKRPLLVAVRGAVVAGANLLRQSNPPGAVEAEDDIGRITLETHGPQRREVSVSVELDRDVQLRKVEVEGKCVPFPPANGQGPVALYRVQNATQVGVHAGATTGHVRHGDAVSLPFRFNAAIALPKDTCERSPT